MTSRLRVLLWILVLAIVAALGTSFYLGVGQVKAPTIGSTLQPQTRTNTTDQSVSKADGSPHAVFPFVSDDSPAKTYQDMLYGFSFLYPSSWTQMNQTELENLASPQRIVKEFSIQSPDKQNIVRFIVLALSDLMATDPGGSECIYYIYNPPTQTWFSHTIQNNGFCSGSEDISTTTIASNTVVGTNIKALSSSKDIDPKVYFIPLNDKYGLLVELINKSSSAPNVYPNAQIILDSLQLTQ